MLKVQAHVSPGIPAFYTVGLFEAEPADKFGTLSQCDVTCGPTCSNGFPCVAAISKRTGSSRAGGVAPKAPVSRGSGK
jgi:hypothetical protein